VTGLINLGLVKSVAMRSATKNETRKVKNPTFHIKIEVVRDYSQLAKRYAAIQFITCSMLALM